MCVWLCVSVHVGGWVSVCVRARAFLPWRGWEGGWGGVVMERERERERDGVLQVALSLLALSQFFFELFLDFVYLCIHFPYFY